MGWALVPGLKDIVIGSEMVVGLGNRLNSFKLGISPFWALTLAL